jgi:hypothetical protein
MEQDREILISPWIPYTIAFCTPKRAGFSRGDAGGAEGKLIYAVLKPLRPLPVPPCCLTFPTQTCFPLFIFAKSGAEIGLTDNQIRIPANLLDNGFLMIKNCLVYKNDATVKFQSGALNTRYNSLKEQLLCIM